MAVLVVTAHDDDTATRVCRALDAHGHDYARMDLGDFPEKLSFSASGPGPAWSGRLSDGQRDLTLADIEAVYWRRPTTFRLPAHLSEQQRRFAVAEARQGLGGLISCLPVPFVNHPSHVADAELKPAQLRAAAEIGLVVAPTLITSSGSEARQFADRYGKVLYKPLTSAFLRADDQVKLVYATLVGASEIDDASIALSPCQFQAFIPKARTFAWSRSDRSASPSRSMPAQTGPMWTGERTTPHCLTRQSRRPPVAEPLPGPTTTQPGAAWAPIARPWICQTRPMPRGLVGARDRAAHR
jgi:hypothetical protein